MTIYLDFDGTVVEHNYPELGAYNEGCFEVVSKLQIAGYQFILNTYRANVQDGTLEEALYFLKKHRHRLYNPIIEATIHKISPPSWNEEELFNTDIIFIDDLSVGIPLRDTVELSNSKMIDWMKLDSIFKKYGLYS